MLVLCDKLFWIHRDLFFWFLTVRYVCLWTLTECLLPQSGRKRLHAHMEVWFMCTWTHWELYYGTMVLLAGFLRQLKECLFVIQISLLFQHPSTHLSDPCWFLRAVYLKQWSHTGPGSEKSFIFLVWCLLSWSCHLPFCWPRLFCFPECHVRCR